MVLLLHYLMLCFSGSLLFLLQISLLVTPCKCLVLYGSQSWLLTRVHWVVHICFSSCASQIVSVFISVESLNGF